MGQEKLKFVIQKDNQKELVSGLVPQKEQQPSASAAKRHIGLLSRARGTRGPQSRRTPPACRPAGLGERQGASGLQAPAAGTRPAALRLSGGGPGRHRSLHTGCTAALQVENWKMCKWSCLSLSQAAYDDIRVPSSTQGGYTHGTELPTQDCFC